MKFALLLSAFLLLPSAIASPVMVVNTPAAGDSEPWLDANYARRAKITILSSQVTTTMSGQVALIALADMAATFHTNVRSDAYDVRFSAADKTTAIDHDLEYYDAATDTGWVWVYVGSISSSSDTVIYIYYDYASAADGTHQDVWDASGADYMAVYHMDDTATGAQSSANGIPDIDADPYNMESGDRILGKIGYCIDFDGSNEYYSVPITDATNNLRPDTSFTAHCWFSADDFSDGVMFQGSGNSTSGGYGAWIWDSQLRPSLGNGGNVWSNITEPTSGLSTGTWYHIAMTWNGSSAKFYLDGAEVTDSPETEGGSWTWSNQPFFIGRRESSGYYHGKVDEVRVHDSVHVDINWLHQNMHDPGSTYTVAAEELQ